MDLTQQLDDVEKRYNALSSQMADPDVINDSEKYRKTAKMHRDLEETVGVYREYKKAVEELTQARQMIEDEDPDLRAMAQEEITRLEPETARLAAELEILLLPKDPNDEKNVLLEIRAGAGGDEASLFAAEIFRLYSRYADSKRWKVEVISASESGAGGSKEVIAMVGGDRVFSKLKYESGVHRVQRVPVTEQQGRIHTSTITVAVMPEADDVEIKLEPKDVRVDTFCSSGPGGQSVNTTYSAVRLTHLPTGLVVSCQDEKSQIKNRAKAERVLRSRLYELEMEKQQQAIGADRRSQVGTGDRSEKIRTYNFKENRVTDHRIGLTLHQLDRVMEGEIEELLTACVNHFNAQKLKEQADSSQADLNSNKKDDGKDRGPAGK
ncbi:peptide chain release factor 1 [Paludibaculum fermentans]|uniref:Peptide chain release factor 1 n=1 Tax=Paludibaculum fermentans TaxID=1473598 RepID=A0A7S7NQB1_PALFE|nr:peptide chain release factor 1 [Paludibaculum fermentans]QOY87806.1 peptide chain release factor 1 [Paludibaculum fermentans]